MAAKGLGAAPAGSCTSERVMSQVSVQGQCEDTDRKQGRACKTLDWQQGVQHGEQRGYRCVSEVCVHRRWVRRCHRAGHGMPALPMVAQSAAACC